MESDVETARRRGQIFGEKPRPDKYGKQIPGRPAAADAARGRDVGRGARSKKGSP